MDLNEMNLSLNGCGYLGIYHVGVCSCIKKYCPEVLTHKISGGSVGGLVACAFLCDVPLDVCMRAIFDVSMKVRNGILGPMSPNLNIMRVLYESMDAMLPPDAHVISTGRLHISVTHFDSGNNVLLNSFSSRDELLRSLMCSCFIPLYCGYEPPLIDGERYADAALSNNSPWLNKYTVTVAPFSGNSDICPENDGLFLKAFTLSNTSIGLSPKNMYMLFRVLFPAAPDLQKEMCEQGYNDALRYLRDQGIIPCSDCGTKRRMKHRNCNPPTDTIQSEITNEIEKAIQEFNKNFGYRLFQYRSMKILYYVNMPSIITVKIAYLVISSILQRVQIKAGLDSRWGNFLNRLKDGLYWANPSQREGRPEIKNNLENKNLQNDNRVKVNQTDNEIEDCENDNEIEEWENDNETEDSENDTQSNDSGLSDSELNQQVNTSKNVQNNYHAAAIPLQSTHFSNPIPSL